MTPRLLARLLLGWALATAVACVVVHAGTRVEPPPRPATDVGRWALDALSAARLGEALPAAPAGARAPHEGGPIIVMAWHRGDVVARHVSRGDLASVVERAAAQLSRDPELGALADWRRPRDDPQAVRLTVTLVGEQGPIWLGVPYIENLAPVPLREGLVVAVDDHRVWLTPDELLADRAYDGGVSTPLPDLTFGVDVRSLVDRVARDLGLETADVLDRGTVRRFAATAITPSEYPRATAVNERTLRQAAVDGARFLLRHQQADGRFTYFYDGRTGTARPEVYNLPRHAGAAYFLAQMDHLHGMPEARQGALRALRYVVNRHIRRCGAPDSWCVEEFGHAELGSSALTALAASEVLAKAPDQVAEDLLRGLTVFIRSLQRDDGELMHDYDMQAQQARDVQYLYYSGEAALALLEAHAVLGDDRDLEVARRLMSHLTGAGWSFLGSRYYYGEEHWTCMAAAEAAGRIDNPAALDFCRRWASFNRVVQFREGETPWASAGAYGVGPLIVPRLTPVGSRTEAFVSTYELSRSAGVEDPELRAQVERGLGMLLRWRWDPGPVHLLADPVGAQGGLPGSPVELAVRNDYVQHGCSAMIRWADLLRRERTEGSR